MNLLEQQILDLIQDAFPLVERPYKALAEMLNELAANCDSVNEESETGANPVVSEQAVFEAVERLRASGVIRRIGGVYDSQKLGFISRLCAGKVPASSLDFSAEPHEQTAMEKFAVAANEVPAITHNYIRSHEYNVWFTVIAQNENEIQTIVDKLCAITDLHDMHVMSATRKFKINTVMKGGLDERRKTKDERGERCGAACRPIAEPNSLASKGKDERGERSGTAAAPVDSRQLAVGRNSDERGTERHSDNRRLEESSEFRKTAVDLSASDKSRIRTSCENIPHSLTPFKDWGVSCDELREDIASKRMRRFGAILRHQNAGFAFNAMVCFNIDERRKTKDERGERCGAAIAPVVSKQWLVNRDSDERRVILSGEAAKDPVKSCDLIAQAGSLLASNLHISHCYERPSFEGFPYNVYAMMHANSAEQLNQYIADCVKSLNELQSSPVDYVVLRSVRELKKTSFKFFA
ncbi:MAG: Lrp/AsnC family transcriptional regulator [Fibrobacter sp.]|nr:Lrp/AsnC family transcriptional regulator [Fibrobacter sp.]